MPITQDRMFALVSAAQDYASGLRDLCQAIQRAAELQYALPADRQNWALAYAEVLPLASEVALLSSPVASGTTILVESEHLRRQGRANARSAARKRQGRRLAGIPIRQTAPPSRVYGAPSLGLGLDNLPSYSSPQQQTRGGPELNNAGDPLEEFKSQLSPADLLRFEQMVAEPQPAGPPSLARHLDLAPSAEGEDDLDLSGLASPRPGTEDPV